MLNFLQWLRIVNYQGKNVKLKAPLLTRRKGSAVRVLGGECWICIDLKPGTLSRETGREKLGWDRRDGVTGYRWLALHQGTLSHVLRDLTRRHISFSRWSPSSLFPTTRSSVSKSFIISTRDTSPTWRLFILPRDNEEIGFGKILHFQNQVGPSRNIDYI